MCLRQLQEGSKHSVAHECAQVLMPNQGPSAEAAGATRSQKAPIVMSVASLLFS